MLQPKSGSVRPHKDFLFTGDAVRIAGSTDVCVLSWHGLEKLILLIILTYLSICSEIVQIRFILINHRKENTHLFHQPNPLTTVKEIKANQISSAVGTAPWARRLVLFFQPDACSVYWIIQWCNRNPVSPFNPVPALGTVVIITRAAASVHWWPRTQQGC